MRYLLALLACVALTGCVGDLVPPPAPEVTWLDLAVEPVFEPMRLRTEARPVQIHTVRAGALADDRLLRRTTAHSVQPDDRSRWIEAPSHMVTSALAGEVHGARGIPSTLGAAAMRVTPELRTFEIDETSGVAEARVRLAIECRSGGDLVLLEVFEASSPCLAKTSTAMAEALSQATRGVVTAAASAIVKLAETP